MGRSDRLNSLTIADAMARLFMAPTAPITGRSSSRSLRLASHRHPRIPRAGRSAPLVREAGTVDYRRRRGGNALAPNRD